VVVRVGALQRRRPRVLSAEIALADTRMPTDARTGAVRASGPPETPRPAAAGLGGTVKLRGLGFCLTLLPRSRAPGRKLTIRILIVEDEEPLALLLRYNLEAAGYGVECVARGDETELRLAEELPDLVLLDWMLPGVSGVELCRRIRASKETEHLPVIMLTARGEGPTGCGGSRRAPTTMWSSPSRSRNCSHA